jgi:hydrogenase-4 transcriptional activator
LNKETREYSHGTSGFASARARVRPRPQVGAPRDALMSELDALQVLVDQGLPTEAESRLTSLIAAARKDPEMLARARCALSAALETQGRYHESLEAVRMYEAMDLCLKLDTESISMMRVRISLAYNCNGDHPKAIALLKSALRDLPEAGTEASTGAIYTALARVYRYINEFGIGRDYSQQALESYRKAGDWRGLAEAYFGFALADMHDGRYEDSLENFEQAIRLVGSHSATFLLGKIYGNMAGVCWFLRRPHEGIGYLEKAIGYYERTEHLRNAAEAYNNLGNNLILVGQWNRAQEAFERALALATKVHERGAPMPMILDSLGELRLLRGDLDEARSYLERGVALASEHGNKWYECQALRTLTRCHLATNDTGQALETGGQALEMAERIGDHQAICESYLLLADTHLQCEQADECIAYLQKIGARITDTPADLLYAGEAQRLHGLLAMAQSDTALAVHHFGRAVSIFDLLGDRYRSTRAHYELGRAYASFQPERAAEHLSSAVNTFRELGARLDLARAEEAMAALDRTTPRQQRQRDAGVQLLTLRLAEAVASRELLLRELAAVIRQETNARRVFIFEPDEEQRQRVVIAHGWRNKESTALADAFAAHERDSEREPLARKHDAAVITLRPCNALPATLLISPRDCAQLPGGLALEPLLRVVELGMDVCALRARAYAGGSPEQESVLAGSGLMPGFIHSSPAMTALVEEVHKIRSSDVTVLVTGESGTGKELVARAIHALSSRRQKIFVPFNCTAVPKELSEGYLFGHRRGAFTGAVSDSAGVIRTAAGGTIFLDEIGDLALDLQPKLLRFLQEGEIQPLGEQRPVTVDVRIIAATNTDLEEMVAQGRFREDLYYRLNVIRVRVPPLRERRSEIPTIVDYYVNHYSARFGRSNIQITPQAVDLLMVADWPGNVRQLCNELQRIVARAEDGMLITPEHLSPELRHMNSPASPPATTAAFGVTTADPAVTVPLQNATLAHALGEVERRMITEALRKEKGNIARAARELGLTRRGLYLKLERYELDRRSA